MGIFKDMYELSLFNSDWEYRELRRMLAEAIERGYVADYGSQLELAETQRSNPPKSRSS